VSTYRKKLIEVALPLGAINKESLRRKQKAPKGFPTSFHKWWAQRPIAACCAVLFASLIDDPSAHPDQFPTEGDQQAERDRLLRLMEELIQWENSNNENIFAAAWKEILKSTDGHPPLICDPFCGGGSIPLEAQRLGLESYASDLNPVAVLINKAMLEIPSKFAGRPIVNPKSREEKTLLQKKWRGSKGLAEDVRYYGQWMRDEAEKRIGHLYPKVKITAEMATKRPDLKKYVGNNLTVVAWLWVRTVKCPNPACGNDIPLLSSFVLSSKKGKEVYLVPKISGLSVGFEISGSPPVNFADPKKGLKRGKSGIFGCVSCDTVTTRNYVSEQGKAKNIGQLQTAVVVEGLNQRIYLTADVSQLPDQLPSVDTAGLEIELAPNPRDVWCRNFGLNTPSDLFTPRQLVALTTFSDLVREVCDRVKQDAVLAGMPDDGKGLDAGGTTATAYAESISTYLACLLDRMIYYGSSLTTWLPKDNALRDCMPRQALAMAWDFAEGNPFGKSSGDVMTCANSIANYLELATPRRDAIVTQCDARVIGGNGKKFLFSTDPPYYDNIGYADLSDFFYVWLRRSLKPIFPDLFATLAVPKNEELVALSYRHASKKNAGAFFLEGMSQAMRSLTEQADPNYPITIYYAFKQSETSDDEGTASTGWETFLEAVIHAGLTIRGTWPIRSEGAGRMIAKGTNALASSIVLVCRPREAENVLVATRREFLAALKNELPGALKHLQRSNIAPVDLAQAAIGPGMAVYTRYSNVIEADGSSMKVWSALQSINRAIDETLDEDEGELDSYTRFAITWFESHAFEEGPYGEAETLATARAISVSGVEEAGLLKSAAGKVRLYNRTELNRDWDPRSDNRLTVWEGTQYLIKFQEEEGEQAAAILLSKLSSTAEQARNLAYRLYTFCERKGWFEEALAYNGLVQAWPELEKLAGQGVTTTETGTLPGL
jgi:putative DNA methylase